jgi:hypothetical protein
MKQSIRWEGRPRTRLVASDGTRSASCSVDFSLNTLYQHVTSKKHTWDDMQQCPQWYNVPSTKRRPRPESTSTVTPDGGTMVSGEENQMGQFEKC